MSWVIVLNFEWDGKTKLKKPLYWDGFAWFQDKRYAVVYKDKRGAQRKRNRFVSKFVEIEELK